MAVLAADRGSSIQIDHKSSILEHKVIESEIIYEGGFVGQDSTGYAEALAAGDDFMGVAVEQVDNSSGSSGDKTIKVYSRGFLKNHVVAGVLVTSAVGAPVYASDDQTLTLTKGSNSLVGSLAAYRSDGYADVYFEAAPANDALAADSVDSEHIADDAIDSEHLTDGSIDTAHLSADCVDGTKLADNAVSLEHLDAALTPSHIIKYAAEQLWSGGGASLAITVAGVLATDMVQATIQTVPSQAAYIVSAAATENTVTITLSAANSSNDAVIAYQVIRAAA